MVYSYVKTAYTGQFSRVSKGTTYLPCDYSECGQSPIEMSDLTRNTHHQGRGVNLHVYGVDVTERPTALQYSSKY